MGPIVRFDRSSNHNSTHSERRSGASKPRLNAGVENLESRCLLSAGQDVGKHALAASLLHSGQSRPVAALVGSVTPGDERALALSHVRRPPRAANLAGRFTVRTNVVYTNRGGQTEHLDLYIPTGPAPAGGRPAVVAIPGGGWRWVRRQDLGGRASVLARYGYVVAVIDYAYSSGSPGSKVWPLNFEDVRDAVRWVRGHATKLGVDPNRIAALGESAGGHLANLLGTYPDGPISSEGLSPGASGPGVPDGTSARVEAVVDFYGPADLPTLFRDAPRDRQFLQTFLGGTPDRVPGRYEAASPDRYASPDDPPFLILQGTDDDANPATQSITLAASLRKAGVPVRLILIANERHGFSFTGGVRDNLPDVLAFLDQALNHKPVTTG